MDFDLKATKEIISDEFMNTENFSLVVRSICGDMTAPIQLFAKIGKVVLTIPDICFYKKFESFLKYNQFSEDEYAELSDWIVSYGEKEENALRIINYINNAKSMKKIHYYSNVTRCALSFKLNMSLYFRICNVIDFVFEEDLKFLADNIIDNYDKNFEPNYCTQSLHAVGLMDFNDTIGNFGKYKFNNMSKLVDVCAVSFGNETRYPNPKEEIDKIKAELNF